MSLSTVFSAVVTVKVPASAVETKSPTRFVTAKLLVPLSATVRLVSFPSETASIVKCLLFAAVIEVAPVPV